MTEEIIVDGVNVAECRYFGGNSDTKCHMGLNYTDCFECGELSECYFKQLQRLKQENETWQKTCEVLKEQAQLDGECIDKLIEARDMYAKALEEIKNLCYKGAGVYTNAKVVGIINEVVQ